MPHRFSRPAPSNEQSAVNPVNSKTSDIEPSRDSTVLASRLALLVEKSPDLAALIEAFPETERSAILDHLRCLASMDPQKRAAVLMLTRV